MSVPSISPNGFKVSVSVNPLLRAVDRFRLTGMRRNYEIAWRFLFGWFGHDRTNVALESSTDEPRFSALLKDDRECSIPCESPCLALYQNRKSTLEHLHYSGWALRWEIICVSAIRGCEGDNLSQSLVGHRNCGLTIDNWNACGDAIVTGGCCAAKLCSENSHILCRFLF